MTADLSAQGAAEGRPVRLTDDQRRRPSGPHLRPGHQMDGLGNDLIALTPRPLEEQEVFGHYGPR
jgi:hypothetical protein